MLLRIKLTNETSYLLMLHPFTILCCRCRKFRDISSQKKNKWTCMPLACYFITPVTRLLIDLMRMKKQNDYQLPHLGLSFPFTTFLATTPVETFIDTTHSLSHPCPSTKLFPSRSMHLHKTSPFVIRIMSSKDQQPCKYIRKVVMLNTEELRIFPTCAFHML